ncbi:NAD(P)H-dependent oxidoreductase [Xanthomonas sp. XNM01]|uniref:NADPH-dependent FMN reductase n=1 Tax=Xanthomonas sp. XNM01 TaxID=2769289 RepID=UPI001783C403|nr:NAD(P)H-dependent oxidoreductase [Xanthomonas sp. XNM01]MBD9370605.1 NAD(P)H-dependent oxidoreductase [Xanthomonas sp. XNM01]
MHLPTLRLALLYGSDRPLRFCDTVAGWALQRASAYGGWSIERLDPATPAGRDTPTLLRRVREADAFLVVTPEYNHGYPAPLKAMIDAVYTQWQAKPVAFVSYGGLSGGLRAVEQLRQVFASLHAVPLRDGVSFAHARDQFDAEGGLAAGHPATEAMRLALARLHWWAAALHQARLLSPYERIAA